jgi:predicted secreted protein
MAINKLRGTQVYIKVGDGATPETFTHPCLINTKRGVKFTNTLNKQIVPDCNNPDDPAWQAVIKDALTCAISGAGMLDTAAVASYDAWFRSSTGKNVQVWLGALGYWQGSFQLSDFEVSGDRNVYADVTIALESDGIVNAWTPA